MLIYYVMYGVIGLSVFLAVNLNMAVAQQKKFICAVSFASIILMLALRHQSMGIDLAYTSSFGYLGSFDKLASFSWKEIFSTGKYLNYERGYIFLNKLISVISADRQWFIAVMAILCVLPIGIFVYKKSLSPALSVLIYIGMPLFPLLSSGLRQSLAVGICTLSLYFVEKKKPLKFIFVIWLATLFHYSAYICLAFYPLYHLKIKKSIQTFMIVALPIIFVLRKPLFSVMSKLFKDSAVIDDNGSVTLMLVFILIYIFCFFYNNESTEQTGYMNLFYVVCVCQIFGNISNVAMRVGYYFMPSLLILLPSVINSMKDADDKRFYKFIIGLCFGAFGLHVLKTGSLARSNPYYFFWEF